MEKRNLKEEKEEKEKEKLFLKRGLSGFVSKSKKLRKS